MSPSGAEDLNHDVYLRMLSQGVRVHGHVVRERVYWSDLGTLERYAATHRDMLFGQLPGLNMVIYGSLLVLIVTFLPRGLMGLMGLMGPLGAMGRPGPADESATGSSNAAPWWRRRDG